MIERLNGAAANYENNCISYYFVCAIEYIHNLGVFGSDRMN